MVFSDIVDVLRFINEGKLPESVGAGDQACVGASNKAKRILNDAVHDKVVEILVYLKIPQARADISII